MISRRISSLFSLIAIGLAFYFITRLIGDQWASVRNGVRHVDWRWVIIGLVLFEIYWGYQILLWKRVMKLLGSPLSFYDAMRLYFTNNLLAYIPGKVANVAGMAAVAKRDNISRLHMVSTVVLFQVYSIISGTVLILVMSLVSDGKVRRLIHAEWMPVLIFTAIISVVMISPWAMRAIFRIARKLMGREIQDIHLSLVSHLVHLVRYFFSWFILGAALCFFISAFGHEYSLQISLISVTVVFVASYIIGLIAFFVPVGLGITELGLVYGFMKLFEPVQAIGGAASLRLASITTTVISFFLLMLIGKIGKMCVNRGRK